MTTTEDSTKAKLYTKACSLYDTLKKEDRVDDAQLMVMRLMRRTERFRLCDLEHASECKYPFECMFEEQEGESEDAALDAFNCQMEIVFALDALVEDPDMTGNVDICTLQFVALCERAYGKRTEAAVPAFFDFCVQQNFSKTRPLYSAPTLEQCKREWKRHLMHRAAQSSKTEKSDKICETLEQEMMNEGASLDPTTIDGWRRYYDMLDSIESISGKKKRRISTD